MSADFVVICPACGGDVPLPVASGEPACLRCGRKVEQRDGITLLDAATGAGDYPAAVYDVVAPVEGLHWWHASRNEVIRLALLPAARTRGLTTVAEVGCGTGFVLVALEAAGFAVCGFDMQIEGLRHARRRTAAPLVRCGARALPLARPVDIVALCDVLEHADEAPLLADCRAGLAPRGLLLVTVPALPELWSLEDELSGHRRRYTRATLRAALEANGLRVLLLRPFHSLVTLPALLHRRGRGARRRAQAATPVAVMPATESPGAESPEAGLRPDPTAFFAQALRPPSRAVSLAMRSALCVENRLGTLLTLPYGSSLLALAERDDAPAA